MTSQNTDQEFLSRPPKVQPTNSVFYSTKDAVGWMDQVFYVSTTGTCVWQLVIVKTSVFHEKIEDSFSVRNTRVAVVPSKDFLFTLSENV